MKRCSFVIAGALLTSPLFAQPAVRTIPITGAMFREMAISPDSKKVYCLGDNTGKFYRTGKVWDLETGKELKWAQPTPVNGGKMAFSPDGSRIAISGYGGPDIGVFMIDKKESVHRFSFDDPSQYLVFFPDGKRLLACNQTSIRCWDLDKDGDKAAYNIAAVVRGGCALSPDGKLIACSNVGAQPPVVLIASAETGEKIRTIAMPEGKKPPTSLAFTPDGKTLAGSGNDFVLFETATGKETARLPGASANWNCLSIAKAARLAAFITGDGRGISVVDLAAVKVVHRVPDDPAATVSDLAFTPDGKHLVALYLGRRVGSASFIRVWDASKLAP